jgi:maltokinase
VTVDRELVERLLSRSDPSALLPARRSGEAARIELPLELVACIRLDEACSDLWYLNVRDARGVSYGVPSVATAEGLRRARPGDGAAEALLSRVVESDAGLIGPPLSVIRWHAERCSGERGFEADQTNELVVVGERAVVKWLLHPNSQEQPAPRRLGALVDAGFTGTPRPWGLVSMREAGADVLIATVIEYVADTKDGWEWAVEDVRSLALGETDEATALRSIPQIGRLVAEMHLAFAAGVRSIATDAEAEGWSIEAAEDLREADLGAPASELIKQELALLARFVGAIIIDVHGDLHIGQVLRTSPGDDLSIIDFDGSPTRSAEQRLAQQPAARDVAGMLASLDHVGRVVLHRTEGLDDGQRARVHDWIAEAQRGFLDAYLSRLAEAAEEALLDTRLIRPFQLQQECREFIYAARYLPHWRYAPEGALAALLGSEFERPSITMRERHET